MATDHDGKESNGFATVADVQRLLREEVAPDLLSRLQARLDAAAKALGEDLTAKLAAAQAQTQTATASTAKTVGDKTSEVVGIGGQIIKLAREELLPVVKELLTITDERKRTLAWAMQLRQNDPISAFFYGNQLLPDGLAQQRERAVLEAATAASTSALGKGIDLGAKAAVAAMRQGGGPSGNEAPSSPIADPLKSSSADGQKPGSNVNMTSENGKHPLSMAEAMGL